MLTNARQCALALALGVALGITTTVTLPEQLWTRPLGSRLAVTSDMPPGWSEIKWPFGVDQWSSGKAFKCGVVACGAEVTLYLRAKIGFCNCTKGIVDDAELERHADFDHFGGTHAANAPGRPIAVRWMKGRSRSYAVTGTSPDGKSALLIAFNDRCDAIVGTVIVSHERPAAVEPAIIDFLNGDLVMSWAEVTLGL